MGFNWTTLLLLVSVCCLAEDVLHKSSSKVSDFKAKLARTELAAKPSRLELKTDDDDDFDNVSISDIGISVPPEYANDTVVSDHHFYYNSTFYSNPEDGKNFWIDLSEYGMNITLHEKLSNAYRQAATVELPFEFPFYGNPLKRVTIATGGFMYMGDYLHNWIAATQYVAPLMANFDTGLSSDSVIKSAHNGTAFIVQWDKVHPRNRENDGAFTFQATLLKNGDIIFAYKDIPYAVSTISDSQHPVKVGLSDAYIMEQSVFFIRRKTVYEYNRIHKSNWNISNNTAVYFTALPTCNRFKDCSSCLSSGEKLKCSWCESVKRCSDGIDRQRQSWISNGCNNIKVTTCPVGETTTTVVKSDIPKQTYTSQSKSSSKISTTKSISYATHSTDESTNSVKKSVSSVTHNIDESTISNNVFNSNEAAAHLKHEEESTKNQSSVSPAAIATIMVFLVAMIAASVWIFYAYKYPHSSSGQFLIKYRPSQWSLKKENTDNTGTSSNSRHF